MSSTPGFLDDGPDAPRRFLKALPRIDGAPNLTDEDVQKNLAKWRHPGCAIHAATGESDDLLLCSHPTAAGGYCLLAVPNGNAPLTQKLIDHHPLPVWANDADTGEILFCNDKAMSLFGVSAETARDYGVADFFADRDENKHVLGELRARGHIESYVLRARSALGREFWVSGAGNLIRHEGREIVFSAIQDVTSLKEHELEITRSRQLLGDALRTLSEAFALFDEDGCLIIWNDRYRALNAGIADFITAGIHWETLLRETARRKIARYAEGRESAWIADMLARGENFESFEIERTDGSCIAVSVHPTTLGGFIVSETDVTSQKIAEQMAEESELLLSKILEGSPANLCMARIGDGEVIYRSPACADIFGHETSAREQFSDPMAWADFLTDLLPSGRVDDFFATARNAEGQEFPALFSARIVEYRGEDAIVSTVTDLTEQVRASRELADANTRLRDAIESLDEGFALYDSNDRLVMWNQRYAVLNEHVAHKIYKGVTYGELLDAAIASGHLGPSDIARTLESGNPDLDAKPRRFEFEHKDGKWFSVARNPTSERGFVITRLDITERKKVEAAQREADELLHRVLDACPVNLLMCRSDNGRVIYHSANTVERFGRRDWVSDYWVDIDAGIRMSKDITAQGGEDLRLFEIKSARDEPVTVELSSRKIDFRGEPMIVSHAYDMTDRLAMEDELDRQRDMLHQSEKLSALGELLAGVAHELNNPLSVVVGHALMLQEEVADTGLLARIDKISSAAERCSRIVKTFLAMARQRPAKLELISLNSVIETAMDVAGYGLRSTGAAVTLELAGGLPQVMGDADQLAQVFANLIVNAEHELAGKGAAGAFSIRSRLARSGREVVVEVEDNGPGIPEAIRARIFEPFFTTKAIGEGTGIGLAFCHRIIDTHDGLISVRNKEGGGARFSIRLKVADQAGLAAGAAPDTPAQHHDNGRALVVDDDEDIAALISQILTADGYLVTVAHSAEAALAQLPGKFDLILSDLNMPDINGREFLGIIQERWPMLARRVGFITGDTASETIDSFLRATALPYLEKPIAPADLRRMAAEMMKQA
ncbi:PAS-domain containing protein [Rhodobacteraceae bacterium NNCM2]|nr:PAS-domain containing protein [Coraliihabitans acroporae]